MFGFVRKISRALAIAAIGLGSIAYAQINNGGGPSAAVNAGNGLSAAGNTLSVVYGNVANSAMQGNNTSFSTGNFSGAITSMLPITGALNAGAFSYGTLGYTDTNLFASFSTSVNSYAQIVVQNKNSGATASTDYVVSNDVGTATTYYGNFGMNSSGFTGSSVFNQPSYVYLTSTSSDLAIGTTTGNSIHFAVSNGSSDSMTINASGNTTIGGILTVTGNTNTNGLSGTTGSFSGGFNASSLSAVTGSFSGAVGAASISTTGNISDGGTLNVTGNTTLGGNLYQNGTLYAAYAINEAPPVTLASAATVNIGQAASNNVTITGTTTITAFDNVAAGIKRTVKFSAPLTLTYNATSLIIPGAQNIVTNPGDTMTARSLGSGNWEVIQYTAAYKADLNKSPIVVVFLGTPATTIAASSVSLIQFDSTWIDTNGLFQTGNNSIKPNYPGYYRFDTQISGSYPGTSGNIYCGFYKNGVIVDYGSTLQTLPSGTNYNTLTAQSIIFMNGSTDYMQVKCTNNTTSAFTITYNNNNWTKMTMQFLRDQ